MSREPHTQPHGGPFHLLGVAGAGLSGLARWLVARGEVVTGHDRSSGAAALALVQEGLEISLGEPSRAAHLPDAARQVIRSAAVPDDDPQVLAARERGLPVTKYAQALGELMPSGRSLCVAGTHGKTTTSWLTLHALRGRLPGTGALIGGLCNRLGTGALAPDADGWVVVEACEYDRSFHHLRPTSAAVTNLEPDHLDCFGTLGALHEAFAHFAGLVDPRGRLILGADVPVAVERGAHCEVWRVGREIRVRELAPEAGLHRFGITTPLGEIGQVRLAVPGAFQVGNAALALSLAACATGELDEALGEGLARMQGVGRRFESWGEVAGRELIHDYAHHPTELSVTIDTARAVFPGRPLHLLFQPHQFERTALFLDEFAAMLARVDGACVTDVYGARRATGQARVATAADLVARARERGAHVQAVGDLSSAPARFAGSLPPRAVGLVVGAGDIESIRDSLTHELSLRSPSQRPAQR